ncbi:hypothetical protein [Priestia flexa]|uniref:hypothetical protein n=1 Tax=Priestia flexa TaxID=86664 RepID=UPI0013D292A4|nr:hypothetical protein [Priestia flexa]
MKKVKLVLTTLFVAAIFLLQPYSINFKAFSQNDASANTENSKNNSEDCLPCQNPNNKGTAAKDFKDTKILNKIKHDVKDWKSHGLSIYGVSDFAWNETVMSDYENAPSVIFVPLKSNPNYGDKKQYMVVGYNKESKELHKPTFLDIEKTKSKDFEFTVGTIDGTDVVNVEVDAETQKAKKVNFLDNDTAFIKQDTAAAGYWQDVQKCLKSRYKQMPSWAQKVCEAACGGCLFASLYACGACLGCLGGYAAGCSLNP